MRNETTPFSDLAAPAQRALQGAGIQTLGQLSQWTETDLMALHGMGPNAMTKLKSALADAGLSLRVDG